ncbi:MAG: bifunctional 4-hydroxy-2-oxoglutarate aldolase/2-dehydro-3-deoxy-phosphogluconate aldolase [Gordonia sp. (in: high G+C Gram-positive bacteria)]
MSAQHRTTDATVFDFPVIPLASVTDLDRVPTVASGLVGGGLPVIEVALRGPLGPQALRLFAGRGDLHVGAGTVLDIEQARRSLDDGATFIVTPGFDANLVRYVQDAGVPVIPGVLSPSEILAARAAGLRRVKLFPAGNFGGLALINAYAQVFTDISFMPSGGVNESNLADYLNHPAVFAASGSWIVNGANETEIAATAAAAVRARSS